MELNLADDLVALRQKYATSTRALASQAKLLTSLRQALAERDSRHAAEQCALLEKEVQVSHQGWEAAEARNQELQLRLYEMDGWQVPCRQLRLYEMGGWQDHTQRTENLLEETRLAASEAQHKYSLLLADAHADVQQQALGAERGRHAEEELHRVTAQLQSCSMVENSTRDEARLASQRAEALGEDLSSSNQEVLRLQRELEEAVQHSRAMQEEVANAIRDRKLVEDTVQAAQSSISDFEAAWREAQQQRDLLAVDLVDAAKQVTTLQQALEEESASGAAATSASIASMTSFREELRSACAAAGIPVPGSPTREQAAGREAAGELAELIRPTDYVMVRRISEKMAATIVEVDVVAACRTQLEEALVESATAATTHSALAAERLAAKEMTASRLQVSERQLAELQLEMAELAKSSQRVSEDLKEAQESSRELSAVGKEAQLAFEREAEAIIGELHHAEAQNSGLAEQLGTCEHHIASLGQEVDMYKRQLEHVSNERDISVTDANQLGAE
eukprot:gene18812-22475_t